MGTDQGLSTSMAVRGSLTAPTMPMVPSLGPHVQLQGAGLEAQQQQLVMALQSGLSNEVSRALNSLAMQSCHEKDDGKKETPSLARVPGLVNALVHVILTWRTSCSSRCRARSPKPGMDGEAGGEGSPIGLDQGRPAFRPSKRRRQAQIESYWEEDVLVSRQCAEWAEEGLLNCDEQVILEKKQLAVAASNILRNLTFLSDNEIPMSQNRRLLEVLIEGMEDPDIEYEDTDEEWVVNSVETFANLAPHVDLRILEAPEAPVTDGNHQVTRSARQALLALKGMLDCSVRAFHVPAAEALARVVVSPDNERFIIAIAAEIYPRAVTLLATGDVEAQAGAVSLLYNLAEVDMACKVLLGGERWAPQRLLRLVRAPHPQPDVCRKAMQILENMASESQNRPIMNPLEHIVVELAMSESRVADIAARVLKQLCADSTSRPLPWGSTL